MQIYSEILVSIYNCQNFVLCDRLISLMAIKFLGTVTYRVFLIFIVHLRDDSANRSEASVCVYNEGSVEFGV